MIIQFSGKVTYADGTPMPGVTVRVWDRDAPGKQDDELTTLPGLSDSEGSFSVSYNPAQFMDYLTADLPDISLPFLHIGGSLRIPDPTDLLLPYLQCSYTILAQPRQATFALSPFQREFRLPELPAANFVPSRDGFHFTNCFPGYPLPFSIPDWLGASKVDRAYGLCGGMSSSAYDFLLASRPIPANSEPPKTGTRLHRYLFRRSVDTFGPMGASLAQISQWMLLPDDTPLGKYKRTYDAFQHVQKRLADQNLTVIALLYVGAQNIAEVGRQIWNNHQVLAFGIQYINEETIDLNVYDPNLPGRDDVVIHLKRVQVGESQNPSQPGAPIWGLQCKQMVAGQDYRPVLGFLEMPYTPVKPPDKI